MARALGIPARIAVGLASCAARSTTTRGPRCTSTRARGRGFWLPVDPTFNQFPADATHLRLARGGLDRQAAILPLIGRLKMKVLDLELGARLDAGPRRPAADRHDAAGDPAARSAPRRLLVACRAAPPRADDRRPRSRQEVRQLHRRRRRHPRRASPARSTASSARTAPARPRPSA